MTDRQAKVNAVAECYLVTGDERHVRRMSADQNLSEDVVAEGIARGEIEYLKRLYYCDLVERLRKATKEIEMTKGRTLSEDIV